MPERTVIAQSLVALHSLPQWDDDIRIRIAVAVEGLVEVVAILIHAGRRTADGRIQDTAPRKVSGRPFDSILDEVISGFEVANELHLGRHRGVQRWTWT